MSVRAVSRMTCIHKTTILSLLVTIGAKCAALFDTTLQNLRPCFVRLTKFGFVQKKRKMMTLKDSQAERGDQYLGIVLDSETKAVLSYYVGT